MIDHLDWADGGEHLMMRACEKFVHELAIRRAIACAPRPLGEGLDHERKGCGASGMHRNPPL